MASCEQGEYVKGENKKKKRNTMIKPNRVFKKMRYIKREWLRKKHSRTRAKKKNECSKTHENKTKKFRKNKQTAKTNKYEKNKKVNRQTSVFLLCNSSTNLSLREVMDREDKRKRETHVLETRRHEEKNRDNRWTKSMSKRTYRGNARIQKGISWIFCDTKEGEIVFEKNW